MWRDPGAWIAIGVSLLFLVVALVMHLTFVATRGAFTRYFAEGATSAFFDTQVALLMHRVIVKVLKNGSTEPSDHE